MRGFILSLWLSLVPLAFSGHAEEGSAEEEGRKRPNIVLITICTLRCDHMGCYGYRRKTTPNIDALARQGARLDQMIASSSWTLPSVTSIFTSLPPSLHGAVSAETKLAEGVTTLAGELRKAGYQTAGVTANPLAGSKFGCGTGFDAYDDYTVRLSSDLNLFGDLADRKPVATAPTGAVVNRIALRWLETKRDPARPFFLFVLYCDPHTDYVPPPPHDRAFDPDYAGPVDGTLNSVRKAQGLGRVNRDHIVALYDGEVRYTDEQVGALLRRMEDLKLADDTIVVLVADHGEEFWDHGNSRHGHTLYEELVHVPCIVRWPGHVRPGSTVKDLVSHVDLMPTFLDAAGVRVPAQCRGRSFMPLLTGKGRFARTEAYLETEARSENLRAIRTANAKVVWDTKRKARHVYDLKADPREARDLAAEEREELKALSQRLDSWWEDVEKRKTALSRPRKPKLDPETLRRLKDLGYMQ